MSCCHYDEGYEEGLEEGRGETPTHSQIATALRVVARKWLTYGNAEQAELLEAAAFEVESMPQLEKELAAEEKRQARVVELYRDSRKIAA